LTFFSIFARKSCEKCKKIKKHIQWNFGKHENVHSSCLKALIDLQSHYGCFFWIFWTKEIFVKDLFFCLNGKLFDVFSARKDDRRLPKSKIRAKFWPLRAFLTIFCVKKHFFWTFGPKFGLLLPSIIAKKPVFWNFQCFFVNI